MNHLIKKMIVVWLLLVAMPVLAAADKDTVIRIINPKFNHSVQVGDVLNRTIVAKGVSGSSLPKAALPLKGEQFDGIELRDVAVETDEQGGQNIYTVALSYQVFAVAEKPVELALPAVHLPLTGADGAIDAPAWKFWYSPLVAQGVIKAKSKMAPQMKPALLDIKTHKNRLFAAIGLFTLGLLGLFYVNADKSWLPWMNGPFAKAHHSIKKLGKDQATSKQAFYAIHQAFNDTHGGHLFAADVDAFVQANPNFAKSKDEIVAFFEQSNNALFISQQDGINQQQDLVALSKRLRDCERGV